MGAPQIIMVVLLCIGTTTRLFAAGKAKDAATAMAAIIALGLEVGLLMWGGFFH